MLPEPDLWQGPITTAALYPGATLGHLGGKKEHTADLLDPATSPSQPLFSPATCKSPGC